MKASLFTSRLMTLVFVLSLLALDFSPVSAATVQVSSLSATTLARSGRLRIFGTGFGTSGQVLIDGQPALIADWADTLIVAYVPETARLATVTVQVVTPGGSSNTVSLTVTTRQGNGRVKWRFQHSGMYTVVRPAVEPGWRTEVDRARRRQRTRRRLRWDDLHRFRVGDPGIQPEWDAQVGVHAEPSGDDFAGAECWT